MQQQQQQLNITPEWFFSWNLETPKIVKSLANLWSEIAPKQLRLWANKRGISEESLIDNMNVLLNMKCTSKSSDEELSKFDALVKKCDNLSLYGICRALHVKIHLSDLDLMAKDIEEPRSPAKSNVANPLHTKLVLQCFLDYLQQLSNELGADNEDAIINKFEEFVNHACLRLVSTVHPNETERNINLLHYSALFDKYIEWTKDFDSLNYLDKTAPEYRIRRERLNHLRREMKAEMEGAYQSDFLRRDPITVSSEARRIMKRYYIIFETYPMLVKFVKHLTKEAFWLWRASVQIKKSPEFNKKFTELIALKPDLSRAEKLQAVKDAFEAVKMMPKKVPKLNNPIITFGTWKGGDRDGNPSVVAAFSNQTFVEQKQFVLQHYLQLANTLIDKITGSLDHISVSQKLVKNIKEDRRLFPYLENIKDFEPYRVKIRYIVEKLSNTLSLTTQVLSKAGDTTRPLLSLTLPGPTGYNTAQELQHDISCIYQELVANGGKSQGRSLLQDFRILVETFGFALTPIDFRQTSDKNSQALIEYLKAVGHAQAHNFSKKSEEEKVELLMSLILSPETEYNPWLMKNVSKITKDTFDSLLVFADAAKTDSRSIGKFIISMCTSPSDILVVFTLLRLTGLIHVEKGKLYGTSIEVTGLFETIQDLKMAPGIIRSVLSIPVIREFVVEQCKRQFTVMLGYSDSVRDGSSLASDANTSKTSVEMKKLQDELNSIEKEKNVEIVIFRGRGDTIARGYGGDIRRSIASQAWTSQNESHTEQNRYLRIYSSNSSALDHLHVVYAAHLTAVTRPLHPQTDRYLKYFEFFGNISTLKWNTLVRDNGDLYFNILEKYSILSILPTCCFASRPVCREATGLNIENVRAIPFTMALCQLREFTNAYYGAGSAFSLGTVILGELELAVKSLINLYLSYSSIEQLVEDVVTKKLETGLHLLIRAVFAEQVKSIESFTTFVVLKTMNQKDNQTHATIEQIAKLYKTLDQGVNTISYLLYDLHFVEKLSPLQLLQDMYSSYAPFRYSVDNKETAVSIRDKKIVDEYTADATPTEKALLNDAEVEAALTRQWVLKISQREELEIHSMKKDFHSPELFLLHKIQARFLKAHRDFVKSVSSHSAAKSKELSLLTVFCQMTILAISEGLGFGG